MSDSENSFVLGLFKERDSLPVFGGKTFEDHVEAWLAVDTSVTSHSWAQAAVAASLQHECGKRTDVKAGSTDIQRFCQEVGISRAQFSKMAKTYRAFSEPVCTGANGLIGNGPLVFKHFFIAANYAKDPVAAVIQAHDQGWSANELAAQLKELRRRTGESSEPPADLGDLRTFKVPMTVSEHREFMRQIRELALHLGVKPGPLASMLRTAVARLHRSLVMAGVSPTGASAEDEELIV
jgi:hypothetical protein